MSKYMRWGIVTISILGFVVLIALLSGCIDSSKPISKTDTSTQKTLVYGFLTIITNDEKTELISLEDNYDKYEVEENVGTVIFRGYTYQTHKITLWRGETKIIKNNVVAYGLSAAIPTNTPQIKAYGFLTIITNDEKTELISLKDNYDKYEVEENVGTVIYRGYTYQTHKITLWRGETKIIKNNVVAYDLRRQLI